MGSELINLAAFSPMIIEKTDGPVQNGVDAEVVMNTTDEPANLKEILNREVELLEGFADREQELQKAILDRKWDRLEGIIDGMSETSQQVLEVERERHECYMSVRREYQCGEEGSFYDFAALLDIGDRMEISELYRRLKVAVMRVQALTGGIGTYVNSATAAVRDILDELNPQRRDRIYSKHGRRSSPDERAMVLDTHL